MIVLDSSFLVAFHNERDAHHGAARGLMERFLEGEWGRGLLLEYVVLERFAKQRDTRLSFVDAAIAQVAEERAGGLVLTFDKELSRVASLHVPAVMQA